jgi:hypothetical protein
MAASRGDTATGTPALGSISSFFLFFFYGQREHGLRGLTAWLGRFEMVVMDMVSFATREEHGLCFVWFLAMVSRWCTGFRSLGWFGGCEPVMG